MKILKIGGALLLLLALNTLKAAELIGSFRVHSYQPSSKILISDLVYIRNLSQEQRNRLDTIEVDTKAYPLKLSKDDVFKLLGFAEFSWKGKNSITPNQSKRYVISSDVLLAKSNSCLHEKLASYNFNFAIKDIQSNSITPIHVRNKNYVLKCDFVNELSEGSIPAKVATKVSVLSNTNKVLGSKTLWNIVKIKLDVYRAKRNIQKYDLLNVKNIELVNQEFDGLNKRNLSLPKQIVSSNFIASSNIRKHSLLTNDTVMIKPEIGENQMATLSMNKGDFEISLKVKAKENGYLNDLIKVIVPSSQETLIARVTGNGEVKIDEN